MFVQISIVCLSSKFNSVVFAFNIYLMYFWCADGRIFPFCKIISGPIKIINATRNEDFFE